MAEPSSPAPFLEELPERCITLFSFPEDVVADPFVGRGTTAAVAARLGRIAWASDRDQTCVAATQEWVAREHSRRLENERYHVSSRQLSAESKPSSCLGNVDVYTMNLITSMPRSSPTEQASEGSSHRALVAAASRVLSTGDRADRAAFLARALNGLADVVPALGTRTLDEAAHAPSDYQALLEAVNSPEVATAWQASDPFAAAHQRAVELKRHLLEAEGGALTVAEVAKRLGISKQAIDKRRRARKLLALETSRGFLYPAWQFSDDGVLPGLEQVLAALEAAPWTQASWFLSGDSRLGDARPLEALRRGHLQQVLRAAAAYGEQGAA